MEAVEQQIDHQGEIRDLDTSTPEVSDGPSELEQHKRARGYTKAPEPPAPVPDATGDVTETVEASEPEKAEKKQEAWVDPDTGDRYDMRHKVARRIKKVLEERAAERAEKAELRKQLDALHQQLVARPSPDTPTQVKPAEGGRNAEPDPSDTSKYPEGQYDRAFIRDQARWAAQETVRQEMETARQASERVSQQRAEAERVQRWQQTLPDVKTRYPDFEAALERIPNTPETAPIANLMMGSPVGNDVVYAVGSDPKLLDAYMRAPSHEHRMRLLYHLEAQALAAQRVAGTNKATTKAPQPTSPVHAGAGPSGPLDWSKDDPDQLQRWKAKRGYR